MLVNQKLVTKFSFFFEKEILVILFQKKILW